MLSNNADEYGGQTVPEKVAEQLHNENTVIVKLTPTSVAPERQKLNVYTSEITQAILIRLSSVAYHAIMQDERRNQIISVTFGNGAFFCQVKESIAAKILPPSVTFEKKMRVEAADLTLITLISESVDERVREKKESYLKATIKIPLTTIDPGPETIKTSINAALNRLDMPNVDKVRAMSDRESGMGTLKYKVVLIEPAQFETNARNFAMLTDVPLPNGSYINLDWEHAVKEKWGLCMGRCNRHLKTDGCACEKKIDGAPKHVKEARRNNFWERMNKKRARFGDQASGAYLPPPGGGGAGPSAGRF